MLIAKSSTTRTDGTDYIHTSLGPSSGRQLASRWLGDDGVSRQRGTGPRQMVAVALKRYGSRGELRNKWWPG